VLAIEPTIIDEYVRTGLVKLVFRDVLNHGERSERASEAAACAGQQNRFWEMHALLFENQADTWATSGAGLVELMLNFGDRIEGLDLSTYARCLETRSTLERLETADAEQRSRGITSQPVFEINGQRLFGLQDFATMSAYIEAALP
jgi:protein-disulfide isomerase